MQGSWSEPRKEGKWPLEVEKRGKKKKKERKKRFFPEISKRNAALVTS